MSEDSIAVAIRVRPVITSEKNNELQEQWTILDKEIFLTSNTQEVFTFDYIFGTDSDNRNLYNAVQPLVQSALSGFNATIFAYGQTSSGKTHSIMGNFSDPGIIPLAVHDMFSTIQNNADKKYILRVAYLEIYNEKINDLLDLANKDMKIREDVNGNLFINSREEIVTDESEMLAVIQRGNKNRQIGETKMNERSSRSHVICDFIIESYIEESEDDTPVKVSHLYIVDLAGSERVSQTKATGVRLHEGVHINKSLSTLISVITQLSNGQPFVNFRDSKLTRLLSNALGGNCRTLIIAAITPVSVETSLSTLKFARRAKKIKNKPRINEIVSHQSIIKQQQSREKKLLAELELEKMKNIESLNMRDDQIKRLEAELQQIYNKFVSRKGKKVSRLPKRRHTMAVLPALEASMLAPILEQSIAEEMPEPEDPNTVDNEKLFSKQEVDAIIKERTNDLQVNYEHLDQSHAALREFTKLELEVEVEERTQQLEKEINKLHQQNMILEAEMDVIKTSQKKQETRRCAELLSRIAELEKLQSIDKTNTQPLSSVEEKCNKLETKVKLVELQSKVLLRENAAFKGQMKKGLTRSNSEPNMAAVNVEDGTVHPKEMFQDIFKSFRQLCSTIISGPKDEEDVIAVVDEEKAAQSAELLKAHNEIELLKHDMNELLVKLKQSNDKLNARDVQLDVEQLSYKSTCEELQQKLSEIQEQLAAKDVYLASLTLEMKNVKDTLTGQIETYKTNLNVQNQRVAELEEQLRRSGDELRQQERNYDEAIQELSKENENALKTIRELNQRIEVVNEKHQKEQEMKLDEHRQLLEGKDAYIKEIADELQKMTNDNESLSRQLHNYQADLQLNVDYETQIRKLNDIILQRQADENHLEDELQKMRDQLEKDAEALEKVRSERDTQSLQFNQCKQELEEAINESKAQLQQLDHYKAELEQKQEVASEFTKKIQILDDELQKMRNKLDNDAEALEKARNESETQSQELHQCKQELETAKNENKAQSQQLDHYKAEQEVATEFMKKLQMLEDIISQKEAHANELEDELEKMRSELKKSSEALEEARNDDQTQSSQQLHQYKQELEEAKNENKSQTQQLDQYKAEMEQQQEVISESTKNIQILGEVILQKEAHANQLENELEKIRSQLDKDTEELDKARNENESQLQQIDYYKEKMEQKQEVATEFTKKTQILEDLVLQKETHAKQLEAELEKMRSKLEKDSEALDKARNENESQARQLDYYKTEMEQRQQVASEFAKKTQILEDLVLQKETHAKQLEDELENMRSKLENDSKEFEKARNERDTQSQQLHQYKQELERAKNENATQSQQLDHYETEMEKRQEVVSELTKKTQILDDELTKMQSKLDKNAEALEIARNESETQSRQLHQYKQEQHEVVAELEKKIKSLETDLHHLKDDLMQSRHKHKADIALLEALKKEYEIVSNEKVKLETEKLQREIINLNAKVQRSQQETAQVIDDLQKQLKMKEKEETEAKHNKEVQNIKESNKKLAFCSDDCLQMMHRYREEHEKLKSDFKAKEARIFCLRNEVERMQRQNESTNVAKQFENAQARIKQLEQEIVLAQSRNVNSNDGLKIVRLQNELKQLQSSSKTQIDKLSKVIIELKQKIQEDRDLFAKKQADYDKELLVLRSQVAKTAQKMKHNHNFVLDIEEALSPIPKKLFILKKINVCHTGTCQKCDSVSQHVKSIQTTCFAHPDWLPVAAVLEKDHAKYLRLLVDARDTLSQVNATPHEQLRQIETKVEEYTKTIDVSIEQLKQKEEYIKFVLDSGALTSSAVDEIGSKNCSSCAFFFNVAEFVKCLQKRLVLTMQIIGCYHQNMKPLQSLCIKVKMCDAKLDELVHTIDRNSSYDVGVKEELEKFKTKYKNVKRLAEMRYEDIIAMKGVLLKENYDINFKVNPIRIVKQSLAQADDDYNPRPVFERQRDYNSGRKSIGATPKHLGPIFGTPDELREASRNARKFRE